MSRKFIIFFIFAWCSLWVGLKGQSSDPYITTLTLEEMSGKQGVVETSIGTIVIDLLPEVAPNHVGLFIELAEAGEYNETIFHRMVKHGVIQGGDPFTKDQSQTELYGRGGLNLIDAEFSDQPHVRGAVSAVLVPGQSNSGGMQFFICVIEQPSLNGKHTVWGRVVEGMDVVTQISETPVDGTGQALTRIFIKSIKIRNTPNPEPLPFSVETDDALSAFQAVVETDFGSITIGFYPDRAPNHVRNFLRLADGGVFDGMSFHRIVKNFVIQSGALSSREQALSEAQERLIQKLEPEFNSTPHVLGVVSMARSDDPASASTSFFICTDVASELDGEYTVFGVVTEGLDVVKVIDNLPTDGENPLERIKINQVNIVKR
tara:strand:- start:10 stop:1134 length:1125 start_codon:yes stop_codon:yes gene_type:complete